MYIYIYSLSICRLPNLQYSVTINMATTVAFSTP